MLPEAPKQATSVHLIYSSSCHKRLRCVSGFSRNFPHVGTATIYWLFKEWSKEHLIFVRIFIMV